MRSHTTTVDGTPVRWQESGEGLPAVLVHGIPTGPDLWRHVVPRVEGGRCLALEMVGYAASIPAGMARPERQLPVSAQADHLLAWLDALEVERAVYVGHDLGGGVAQIAAVRQPRRCAGLVLTNSIGYDNWPIPSVKALRTASEVVARLPDATVAAILATLIVRGHDRVDVARESFGVHWRHYAAHDASAAFARQISALDVDDTLAVAGRLGDLDVPARVVWGAADRFLKVGYGERFAADLGTDLRRIHGGKHFVPEDHPLEVAAAVTEVLKEAA